MYAADVVEEDSKDVDGGTLKQAVILTYTGEKIGGCKKVLVYCANTWITSPRNRGYDVAAVFLKNLTPYSEFNAYYLVTECNIANPGIVIESIRYGNCSYERFLSGFAVYFDLMDDKACA